MVARTNADMIAENCNFEIPTDSRHLPRYEMTKEEKKKYTSNEDMFDSLIYEGLENKPELLEDYSEDVLVERIERESKIIKFGDVVDYFLILRDIVNWCKENNILLGAGRGSASGSLISYLFGIINTHPLKFNLLFERFLTRGRLGHFEKKKMYEVILEDGTKKVLPINTTTKALKVGDDILV